MKMKQKSKRFWNLSVHNHEGFTLVELIIVIAILAILSSVAVAGYSSYIEKAHKQADQTLVAQIKTALELYYYDNMTDGFAVVGITADGIKVESNSFAEAALTAAGISTSNSLKYNKWPSASTSQAVLELFASKKNDASLGGIYSGTAKPSFADDVEDLFDEVQNVATGMFGDDEKAMNGLKGAADVTSSKIDADTFANKWASADAGNFFEVGSNYNANIDPDDYKDDTTMLDNLIANAAVIKARNTSIAGYIRNSINAQIDAANQNGENMTKLTDAQLSAIYTAICNFNYYATVDGALVPTSIPLDIASVANGTATSTTDEGKTLAKLEEAISGIVQDPVVERGIFGGLYGYFNDAEKAKTDALAYYAMMDTVDTVSGTSGNTYWDEMEDAVGLYADIVSGAVTLDELNSAYNAMGNLGNGVVVTAYMSNGMIEIVSTIDGR